MWGQGETEFGGFLFQISQFAFLLFLLIRHRTQVVILHSMHEHIVDGARDFVGGRHQRRHRPQVGFLPSVIRPKRTLTPAD